MELESETLDAQDEIVREQVATIDDGSGKLEKIKEVVSNLRQYVDMENINRISIRRRYAYQDYLAAVARQKKRRRFNQNGMLKVTFIGEPAVDDGGPRREFFFRCVHIGVNLGGDQTFDCETNNVYYKALLVS